MSSYSRNVPEEKLAAYEEIPLIPINHLHGMTLLRDIHPGVALPAENLADKGHQANSIARPNLSNISLSHNPVITAASLCESHSVEKRQV